MSRRPVLASSAKGWSTSDRPAAHTGSSLAQSTRSTGTSQRSAWRPEVRCSRRKGRPARWARANSVRPLLAAPVPKRDTDSFSLPARGCAAEPLPRAAAPAPPRGTRPLAALALTAARAPAAPARGEVAPDPKATRSVARPPRPPLAAPLAPPRVGARPRAAPGGPAGPVKRDITSSARPRQAATPLAARPPPPPPPRAPRAPRVAPRVNPCPWSSLSANQSTLVARLSSPMRIAPVGPPPRAPAIAQRTRCSLPGLREGFWCDARPVFRPARSKKSLSNSALGGVGSAGLLFSTFPLFEASSVGQSLEVLRFATKSQSCDCAARSHCAREALPGQSTVPHFEQLPSGCGRVGASRRGQRRLVRRQTWRSLAACCTRLTA